MLVLQRKKDEAIMIGDDIKVSVIDAGAGWVKLAIEAPRDVSIMRSELVEAAAANKEAAVCQGRAMEQLKNLFRKG